MPGAQTVTLQVSNGLGTDTDTAHLAVVYPMVMAYSVQSNLGQQTVDLTDLTSPAPASRLWTFSDGTTSTLASLTKPFPATGGTFSVQLQVTDACGSLDTSFAVYVSGMGSPEDAWGTWLAPNPTAGKAKWFSANAQLLHWVAVDGLGRVVRTATNSFDLHTLDLTDLPAGVYTILAQTDRGTAPIRLQVVPE
jgi:PKD repeat protein